MASSNLNSSLSLGCIGRLICQKMNGHNVKGHRIYQDARLFADSTLLISCGGHWSNVIIALKASQRADESSSRCLVALTVVSKVAVVVAAVVPISWQTGSSLAFAVVSKVFFEKSKRTQTTKFAHNICEFCLNLFVNNFFYFANFFTQQYTSKRQHFAVPPLPHSLPLPSLYFYFHICTKNFSQTLQNNPK